MADSRLVTYTRWLDEELAGHPRGRNRNFNTIAVHHAVTTGNVDVIASVLASGEVSTHYGIHDYEVGQYVDESNASWSMGSNEWNNKCISIECANSSLGGDYPVSDATLQTLENLCLDIAKRHGWTSVDFSRNPYESDIIGHRDVAATACPGNYLYARLPEIASRVNARLKGGEPTPAGKLVEDGIIGYNTILALQKFLKSPYTDGEISGQLLGASDYVLAVTDDWVFIEGGQGSGTIELFQRYLNEQINAGLELDGYFGEQSIIALQKFLNTKGHSLTVDGLLGEQTALALQQWLNSVA